MLIYYDIYIPDLLLNYQLWCTIKEHGKNLCSINLLLVCHDDYRDLEHDLIPSIIEGCPKLKTLTLQSSGDEEYLMMSKEILEALQKGCKELKHLKLTKVRFEDIFSMEEIKKILPDCNLEFKDVIDDTYDADNSSDDYDSDNSLYVSFVF